jgi:hypothetical protein
VPYTYPAGLSPGAAVTVVSAARVTASAGPVRLAGRNGRMRGTPQIRAGPGTAIRRLGPRASGPG